MKYTTTETFGTRLLDQMAMAALQGIIARPQVSDWRWAEAAANNAYIAAEAMMAERQRRIDAELDNE